MPQNLNSFNYILDLTFQTTIPSSLMTSIYLSSTLNILELSFTKILNWKFNCSFPGLTPSINLGVLCHLQFLISLYTGALSTLVWDTSLQWDGYTSQSTGWSLNFSFHHLPSQRTNFNLLLCCSVASLVVFYHYFHGYCFYELANCLYLPSYNLTTQSFLLTLNSFLSISLMQELNEHLFSFLLLVNSGTLCLICFHLPTT